MSKYNDGEYIPLMWEYGGVEAFYIKGHIDQKIAMDILEAEEEASLYYELGQPIHKFGRWSMQPTENGNGHILQTYKTSGKGRFKITEIEVRRKLCI